MILQSRLPIQGQQRESGNITMSLDRLETAWPAGRCIHPAVLATLEGTGLVRLQMFSLDQLRNPAKYEETGLLTTDNEEGWASTTFGSRLARYIEDDAWF